MDPCEKGLFGRVESGGTPAGPPYCFRHYEMAGHPLSIAARRAFFDLLVLSAVE